MGDNMKKRWLQVLITCVVVSSFIATPVMAAPQDEVNASKERVNASKEKVNASEEKVDTLEQQKKQAEAQASSVNEELVALLVDIDALKQDMETQQGRITQAESDLAQAQADEEKQYEDMKLRIKYMYEEGDTTFFETIADSKSYTDLVNRAEYVQNVHDYDRHMLDEYVKTKNEVKDLKTELESQQAEMQDMAKEMDSQKSNLEGTLTQMRSQIADFDSQLEQAKEEAAEQLAELTKQSEALAKAEEAAEAAAAAESSDHSSSGSTGKPSQGDSSGSSSRPSGGNSSKPSGDNSSSKPDSGKEEGSKPSTPGNASLGQQIANKGLQYVGNKYVFGGNSLTNGIDCSGFVQQIHKQFGISVPRSSSAQRTGGKAVKYSEMLPGDVVCYSGHVAIYIGNNTIVHASNSAPYPKGGIKTTSPANYKTVLAVRRYW